MQPILGETRDDFWKPFAEGGRTQEASYKAGVAVFCRANDFERLDILAEILERPEVPTDQIDTPMIGGFLRLAWTDEPYLDGMRAGNYLTALERQDGVVRCVEQFFERWGDAMMTAEEREALGTFRFPLTVYRGGVGRSRDVMRGSIWTLCLKEAKFFAVNWPRRWGRKGEPVILLMKVGRSNLFAFFNDSGEQEVVVRNSPVLARSRAGRVPAKEWPAD